MTSWKQHKVKWTNCDKCILSSRRCSVVLGRGCVPCDIVFCGEAPGKSEDVLGRPFVGPAGKLFDDIISTSIESSGINYTYALTNIIACIPKDEEGNKVEQGKDIPKEAIKQCSDRLEEFMELAQPKGIVWVGGFAAKHGPRVEWEDIPQVSVTHPAAILRANVANKPLSIQTAFVTIRDLVEEVCK